MLQKRISVYNTDKFLYHCDLDPGYFGVNQRYVSDEEFLDLKEFEKHLEKNQKMLKDIEEREEVPDDDIWGIVAKL